MNCTAWNSVRANALTNRPSDIPSRAFPTASATTAAVEPATCRPSSPKATAEVITACSVATIAKAIP